MTVTFRQSFLRDLKKIRDATILQRVRNAIAEIEAADNLLALPNVRKMAGSGNFYRYRIGEYRIGIAVTADVVDLVRCLNRREIYRYFP